MIKKKFDTVLFFVYFNFVLFYLFYFSIFALEKKRKSFFFSFFFLRNGLTCLVDSYIYKKYYGFETNFEHLFSLAPNIFLIYIYIYIYICICVCTPKFLFLDIKWKIRNWIKFLRLINVGWKHKFNVFLTNFFFLNWSLLQQI